MPDEQLCISGFINGTPENLIDKIVLRAVQFRGWGEKIDSEDLVQTIRLILLKNFKEGKYRGEGLRTYVRRIAETQCLLEIRRRYTEEKHLERWSKSALDRPDPNPEPLPLLIEKERKQKAIKVLKALEKLCLQLLLLKFHKHLSYQEIAKHLKMTEVNVRVSIHRCLNKSKEIAKKFEENL